MSLPPSPGQPPHPTGPSTKEIPLPAPAATGAMQVLPPPAADAAPAGAPGAPSGPAPVTTQLPPVPEPQPTGPVDFVPGLPSGSTAATPPEEPAAQGKVRVRPKARAPRNRAALAGLGLVAASVLLLELGLALGFGGRTLWSTVPLWSAFATVAALLGGLAFAGRQRKGERRRNDRAWKLSLVGLAGLAVFWVLVVLPVAATDRGFLLTAALGCLGVALRIAPGRRA